MPRTARYRYGILNLGTKNTERCFIIMRWKRLFSLPLNICLQTSCQQTVQTPLYLNKGSLFFFKFALFTNNLHHRNRIFLKKSANVNDKFDSGKTFARNKRSNRWFWSIVTTNQNCAVMTTVRKVIYIIIRPVWLHLFFVFNGKTQHVDRQVT